MKLFITGHKGFLGKKLSEYLTEKGHKIYYDDNLDVTKKEDCIMKDKFDAVIHCAAMTDVDGCERDRYNAWRVNVEGTVNVANACKVKGIKLVHISTDYVLKAINHYAVTKLVAEEKIKEILPNNHLIVRTSTLYGYNDKEDKKTFVTWILGQKDKVKTINDNVTHPTLIDDIAENIELLLNNNTKGVVNIVGKDCISKYDFANEIIKVFDLKLKNERIWSGQVKAWIAKRPFELRLINTNGVVTHNTNEGLEIMKRQMEADK